MIENFPKIYSISEASQKGFAWASGYGPFEGMDFFPRLHLVTQRSFMDFWEVNHKPPGISLGETGTKWPDIMFCGNPPPFAFFSDRIVEDLLDFGVEFEGVTPIPLGPIKSKKLRSVPAPAYHVLEAKVGISIDYEASGIAMDDNGQPMLPVGQAVVVHLDPETWSGADVFKCSNWPRGGMDLLCTDRVKQLALAQGWTNVDFVRQRVKGVNPFA
ncbi:hypothetical protein [Luteolibacter sp. LG18]|uniref:hypothetical protein n=1 Tax=Luteolibacter sp. LG18 TaxID=2819286 RepID=UPI0030C68BA0